jgi:hypothetical protein
MTDIAIQFPYIRLHYSSFRLRTMLNSRVSFNFSISVFQGNWLEQRFAALD